MFIKKLLFKFVVLLFCKKAFVNFFGLQNKNFWFGCESKMRTDEVNKFTDHDEHDLVFTFMLCHSSK